MSETMLEARTRYFRDNRFGDDGGYGDKWVDIAVGPLHVPFPNTAGRVRAVRYHDLHHLVTGYTTDLVGEAEIGAWELGAGCKSLAAAWFLNLTVMAMGMVRAPGRTFAAFVRGRRSDSLYGQPFEPLLAETVDEVRARTHVPSAAAARPASLADRALFGAAVVGSLGAATVALAVTVVLLPFGLAALAAKRARATA